MIFDRCPECIRLGKVGIVTRDPEYSTTLALCSPFIDEAGVEHKHDRKSSL
jgi:hypothetical protein